MKRYSAVLLFLVTACCFAAEKPYSAAWMVYYYMNPEPDDFVAQVQGMAKAGELKKGGAPMLVGFFSRLMVQNPDRIDAWMKALDELSLEEKRVLYNALWYSDTDEAKAYLQKNNLGSYLRKNPPDILTMSPDNPTTLDMLWGYFVATGEPAPIRRIVSVLNLAPNAGALDRFKNSMRSEKDQKSAFMDSTYQTTRWLLLSGCVAHPQLMTICESFVKEGNLTPIESKALNAILTEVHAERGEGSMMRGENPGIMTPSQEAAPQMTTEPAK